MFQKNSCFPFATSLPQPQNCPPLNSEPQKRPLLALFLGHFPEGIITAARFSRVKSLEQYRVYAYFRQFCRNPTRLFQPEETRPLRPKPNTQILPNVRSFAPIAGREKRFPLPGVSLSGGWSMAKWAIGMWATGSFFPSGTENKPFSKRKPETLTSLNI